MNNILPWFSRIRIFFTERYYPVPYIIATTLNAFALFFTVRMTNLIEFDSFTKIALVAFNSFSFPLVMRICDEYKDLDSDLIHFPERCIPRGAVSIQDVTILGCIFIFLFTLFNFVFLYLNHKSILPIVGLFIYLYLFLKYFFFPKQVSGNLIIALIVSNPITYCLFLYNLYLLIPDFQFSYPVFFISLLFWMPSFIWETARKIKIPSDETTYQTYSLFLGIPGACAIPTLGIGLMCTILTFLSINHVWRNYYIFLCSLLVSFYFFYMLFFVLKPTRKQSQNIQKITEIILMLIVFIEISFFYR